MSVTTQLDLGPLVGWLEVHTTIERVLSTIALVVATTAGIYAKRQANVAAASLEESKQANAKAHMIARQQLSIDAHQHLEANTPWIDVVERGIERPFVSDGERSQPLLPGQEFDWLNNRFVLLGYEVTATILNYGGRPVQLRPSATVEFIEDPTAGLSRPFELYPGNVYLLPADQRARIRWKPTHVLEVWMKRFAHPYGQMYPASGPEMIAGWEDALTLACTVAPDGGVQFDLALTLEAEVVWPEDPQDRGFCVERDEVRKRGMKPFVWVPSGYPPYIRVSRERHTAA
ncbi:hypothetical protein AB0H43_02020 [Hamadaea sp. NPDC050747]|uniref:hypothetical protein n=1 Tax=Hamadaea sp. NPDC050747 TaxID=3155789 RepID=UPI003407D4A0